MRNFTFAITIATVRAYDQTIGDCQTFAAKFNGTCGGVTATDAYTSHPGTWANPSSITCAIRGTLESDDPTTVKCKDGNSASSCAVARKNCVTCRADGDKVYIRY